MKIRKLHLQNFRGFEDKTFEFSDQFNVLIGDNGTGKTSILKALAVVATPAFMQLGGGGIGISADDIRQVRYEKGSSLTLEPQYPFILSCEGVFSGREYTWGKKKQDSAGKTKNFGWDFGSLKKLREQVQDGKDVLLPLFAFFDSERRWPSKKQSAGWHKPGSRIEGNAGGTQPSTNWSSFLGLLKAQQAIALQQGTDASVLVAVKQAITRCMENWGEIFYDFKEDDLIATSVDGTHILPFHMLSDGERNMLAMVADLARRTAVLNPHLEEQALAKTPGIVLIDELDLHLHPRWQRRVVDNLRDTFPKLQFITTTHSPFIIQSLRPGELIDLNEREPADYENESIEDITENVMGVEVPQRSRRYQEMMDVAEEYYRVLQQAQSVSSEEVERLKNRLDELSAPFSDDMAYQAFLKMEREAAGLGENGS